MSILIQTSTSTSTSTSSETIQLPSLTSSLLSYLNVQTETRWIGNIDYNEALILQDYYITNISEMNKHCTDNKENNYDYCDYDSHHHIQKTKAILLGLEHPLVITLGKRANIIKDLKISCEETKIKNVKISTVNRGGEATLHSPGQLVIYPIIPLDYLKIAIKHFVYFLEEATIKLLQTYNIDAYRGKTRSEPGIYTTKGKIAFFGLRINKGISSHGLSININNNLDYFQWIRSCGKENEQFDQFSNYEIKDSIEQIFMNWATLFFNEIFTLRP